MAKEKLGPCTMRVPISISRRLDAIADKAGLTASNVVALALARYFEHQEAANGRD